MIEPAAYDLIGQKMLGIVEVARVALTARGFSPDRVVHVVPGSLPAFDEACDGLLYGRIESVTFDSSSQFRDFGGNVCGDSRMLVTVAVGLVRCISVVDDRGAAPAPSEILLDGLHMTENAQTIHEGLSMVDGLNIRSWRPLAAEGGVTGGEWGLVFSIPVCDAGEDVQFAIRSYLEVEGA